MKKKANKNIITLLEKEIKILSKEMKTKNDRLDYLENLIVELKKSRSYQASSLKYDIIKEKYEKEKERLVKLHHLYKIMEADYFELEEEVEEWRSWFDVHGDLLNKLFSKAPQRNKQKNAIKSARASSNGKNKKRKEKQKSKKSIKLRRKSSTVRS